MVLAAAFLGVDGLITMVLIGAAAVPGFLADVDLAAGLVLEVEPVVAALLRAGLAAAAGDALVGDLAGTFVAGLAAALAGARTADLAGAFVAVFAGAFADALTAGLAVAVAADLAATLRAGALAAALASDLAAFCADFFSANSVAALDTGLAAPSFRRTGTSPQSSSRR